MVVDELPLASSSSLVANAAEPSKRYTENPSGDVTRKSASRRISAMVTRAIQ
jgi:hypothetical protein